ncbi:secretion protein EspA [Shewanella sp. OPT22]|nr:secretion protein EspA [Shewanella sp. OPT22]
MVHHHVTSSVNTLKDKYGLNDDKLKHVHNLVEADNAMASQGDIVLSGGIAVLYLFMNLLSDIAQFKYTEMQQKAKVSRDAQSMANKVQEIIADISKGSDPDTATKPLPDDVIKYMEQNDIKVGDQTIDQYLGGKRQAPAKTWTMTQYSNDWHKTTGTIQVYKKDGKFYQWDAKNHKGTEIKGVSDKYGEGKLFYQPDGKKNGYWMSWGDSKNANSTTNTPMKDDGFNNNALDKGKLDAVKSALENESNRASDYVSQSQLQLQKVMQTYNVTVSLINSMQTMLEEMNKSIAQNIR